MKISNIKLNNEINRRRALEAWEELKRKSPPSPPEKSDAEA